jgi:hypothetical protein
LAKSRQAGSGLPNGTRVFEISSSLLRWINLDAE